MPIKIRSLGKAGVYVDPNVLSETTPPNALLLSQNAEHDFSRGYEGTLRKRAGWAIFNPVNAGGAILGGIPMPVAGTGGAPASGGGATIGTGDPTKPSGTPPPGGGDGTGKPGGTTTGGPRTVPTPGAGIWNPPFSGTRVVAIARKGTDGVSNAGGAGWFLTSKNLANASTSPPTPGPPAASYSFPPASVFVDMFGTPGCVVDGVLYYAGAHGDQTLGTSGAPIRVNNGATDSILATIQLQNESANPEAFTNFPTPGGVNRLAIMSMHAGSDGNIYIGVKDKYYGQATSGNAGRVFRLVPTTGNLTNLTLLPPYNAAGGGYDRIPYCTAYFDGHVFWGEFLKQSATNKTCSVLATSSDETYIAVDYTPGYQTASMISALCVWRGSLWAGTGCNQDDSGTGDGSYQADPLVRFAGGSLGSLSNWQGFQYDDTRLGIHNFGNIITSIVVFNSDLYLAYYSPGHAAYIHKLTQPGTDNLTAANFNVTATKVFNNTATFPYTLFVDDGILYAVGSKIGTNDVSVFTSPDGTNWTSKTSQLTSDGLTSTTRPILFGVNQ